ncbi:MAG TPA: ATP-binding cassette domain-containing protein [Gemmataceae bacterium]|nr:ATP-binding cassette domain-containing protein [Gemmataceae bacterium]
MSILETHALTRRYGSHVVVDGLTLTVEAGEVFGLLGPNGAGKTTTIKNAADAAGSHLRQRFMGIGQVLTMPLFFASNALYPVFMMPTWLQVLSPINPLACAPGLAPFGTYRLWLAVLQRGAACFYASQQDVAPPPFRQTCAEMKANAQLREPDVESLGLLPYNTSCGWVFDFFWRRPANSCVLPWMLR